MKFYTNDMIINSPNLVPCPAKRCEKIFYCEETLISVHNQLPARDGMCDCNEIICFRCKLHGHEPLDCGMMEDWQENLDKVYDQLNTEWKKKNTKKCPKCKVDIQKNEGCMHMTCRQCHYEFCWLCLGDWKIHGSSTGGFYDCNLYKQEAHEEDDEEKRKAELIKRLQFFTDRYFEQKRACELTKDKIEEINEKLSMKSGTDVSKFNYDHNGGLEFYHEAYSYLLQCRNFVLHSYPLSYRIIDPEKNLLFTQTQSMLTHALETFNKFLENNSIENFVMLKDGNVYHSETFPEKKAELLDLHNTLNLQFKGAQYSFCNPQFQEKVKRMFMKASQSDIGWYENKDHNKGEDGVNPNQPPASWYCSRCTFWNGNNLQETCTMCGMNGRPVQ